MLPQQKDEVTNLHGGTNKDIMSTIWSHIHNRKLRRNLSTISLQKRSVPIYLWQLQSLYVQDYEQFKQKEASGKCGSGKETNTQSAAVVADILKEMPWVKLLLKCHLHKEEHLVGKSYIHMVTAQKQVQPVGPITALIVRLCRGCTHIGYGRYWLPVKNHLSLFSTRDC